jgi:protein TonB
MNRTEPLQGDGGTSKPIGRAAIAAPAREPLIARKRVERRESRRRVAAQTRVALTPAQRALDPLGHPRRGWFLRGALALLLACAIQVGVVAIGFVLGGKDQGRRERVEQTVRVEVREPPPPPPPPEEKRPEPPKPEPIVKKTQAPPPKAKAPEPTPKGPPPRVVGISLDSTVEGGGGPAFATGETHQGQTAEHAATPKPAEAPPAPAPAPAQVAQNAVASRIPVAGVKYTPPKRRRPHEPVYPETLKAQEIEADVNVMVSIDATGKVTKVKIIAPSPYPEFNQAAEKAAFEEEFEPALRGDVAIPYSLSYTYRFRLETK